MEILNIIEPDDNNKFCRIECTFTKEELEILLNYAVTNILKEQLLKMNKEFEKENATIECYDCGSRIDEETLVRYPNTAICGKCMLRY